MSPRLGFAPVAWPQAADALGFSAPDAAGACARNGFALRSEGDWLALTDRGPVSEPPLDGGLGSPGLWRVVREGETLARVHDLPPLRGLEEDATEDGAPSLASLACFLEWAAATRSGRLDPEWAPPQREEVESWLEPSRLRVRAGALLAAGELVHEPGRLALVFPVLAPVPEDLSAARRSWLDALLLDAQRRWRLVRFGVDAHARCVRAEVDLSGVPAVWARPFVQLAPEALAWAVAWVLSPLSFLVDPDAPSQALDRLSFDSLTRSTTR